MNVPTRLESGLMLHDKRFRLWKTRHVSHCFQRNIRRSTQNVVHSDIVVPQNPLNSKQRRLVLQNWVFRLMLHPYLATHRYLLKL